MRCVLQRVRSASVEIVGQTAAQIDLGLLVYLAFAHGDQASDFDWMLRKILNLRIFADEQGRMNRSVQDVRGALLLVSQFTLYADCQRGMRPSFTDAMKPELAARLYKDFVQLALQSPVPVQSGVFAADMLVSSQNDGPVTIILNSKKQS